MANILVTMSDEMRDAIEAEAEKSGQQLSRWCRESLQKHLEQLGHSDLGEAPRPGRKPAVAVQRSPGPDFHGA